MTIYESMKDSGIEWIGEIPKHWKVFRGKNFMNLLNRPIKNDDEVITCFRDGEVTLRKNRREEGFTNSLKEIGYQGIEPGDLVVHGMDGFAGAIGVSDSRGKASPVLNVINSNQNKRYLMYYLRCLAYRDVFIGLSTGIRVRSCDLRWNKLANLLYLIPTFDEQNAIVSYLDSTCSDIDTAIAEAKASIEDYKLLKQSIITQAVTKGLEPNVPMKNSGVDWIGEIPKDWSTAKLNHISKSIQNGYVGPTRDLFVDEGIKYIQSLHIKEGVIDFNRQEYYVREEWANDHPKIHKDQLLIVQTGDIGQVGLVNSDYDNCNCHALIIVSLNKQIVLPKFVTYYFMGHPGKELLLRTKTGALLPHLNSTRIGSTPICYPSYKEQEQIAEFLDTKCSEINSLICEKEAMIADLEAYKKSLIFEVVTGKRKVC